METDVQQHQILFLPEVAERLRLSPGTVNRLLAQRRKGEGHFPLPLSGTKCKGRWLASDVDKYIESLASINIPVQVQTVKQQKQNYQKRQEAARKILRQHGIDCK